MADETPCAKTNPRAWWLSPSIQWWKSPVSTSFQPLFTAWFLCSMLKIMRHWWNPNYLLLKSPKFAGEIPIFTTEIPGSGWFHGRICRSLTLRRGRNARVQLWGCGRGAPHVRRRHGGVQRLWKRWKLRILQIDTPTQLPNGTLGILMKDGSDIIYIYNHIYIYNYIYILSYIYIILAVVPHKAVAEVSKIGNL